MSRTIFVSFYVQNEEKIRNENLAREWVKYFGKSKSNGSSCHRSQIHRIGIHSTIAIKFMRNIDHWIWTFLYDWCGSRMDLQSSDKEEQMKERERKKSSDKKNGKREKNEQRGKKFQIFLNFRKSCFGKFCDHCLHFHSTSSFFLSLSFFSFFLFLSLSPTWRIWKERGGIWPEEKFMRHDSFFLPKYNVNFHIQVLSLRFFFFHVHILLFHTNFHFRCIFAL